MTNTESVGSQFPHPLSFNTLREANKQRIPTFKNKKGECIHNEDGSDWSISDWYEALSGEAGEFANFHKKFRRGELTEQEFLTEAAKELADVQIYLDILAFRLGLDLGQIVADKFNEVSRRVKSPIFIAKTFQHYVGLGLGPLETIVVDTRVADTF
jgi:NTP pyrophosphatase (non-canonical NTP hydrolase)